MLTELFFISPLAMAYFFNYLKMRHILPLLFTVYWLPKFPVIYSLEYFYPTIRTRNDLIYTNDKKIYLTFDDVPYDDDTFKEILCRLEKYNFTATFFIISDYVKPNSPQYQNLVKAVQSGHHLGNHGQTNTMHWLKSKDNLSKEIDDCNELIAKIYSDANCGAEPIDVYRPGCGMFGKQMLDIIKKKDMTLVLGSVYPNDPIVRSGYINYLYIRSHLATGDIVIVHDRKWTLSMLDNLLPWMMTNGYRSRALER